MWQRCVSLDVLAQTSSNTGSHNVRTNGLRSATEDADSICAICAKQAAPGAEVFLSQTAVKQTVLYTVPSAGTWQPLQAARHSLLSPAGWSTQVGHCLPQQFAQVR